MPERNGIETAEWIRNFEVIKQKRSVPIMGLTGHESASIKEICMTAGMNKVLTKPISRVDALNAVKAFM